MYHELKCSCKLFPSLWNGAKRFEYRLNDRDYNVNDVLRLAEYDSIAGRYTGRVIICYVSYILNNEMGFPELKSYVILSLSDVQCFTLNS